MTGDASLDDFLDHDRSGKESSAGDDAGVGDGETADAEAGADPVDAEAGADPVDAEAGADPAEGAAGTDPGEADPARSTLASAPEREACERCGERVRRRWRDDGALVCTGCKDW